MLGRTAHGRPRPSTDRPRRTAASAAVRRTATVAVRRDRDRRRASSVPRRSARHRRPLGTAGRHPRRRTPVAPGGRRSRRAGWHLCL